MLNQAAKPKRVGAEQEAEIDTAQVGLLIKCVCGPERKKPISYKEEVDGNKAEVA